MNTQKLLLLLAFCPAVAVIETRLRGQTPPEHHPEKVDRAQTSPARFSALPTLPDARFLPIPPLELLPPAPIGLCELASAIATSDLNDQEKVVGSDFPKKMTKTEGLASLTKPLEPFEIVRRTDAKKSRPEKESFIEKSWQNFGSLQSPQSQPDPRYLRHWPENSATWASPAFCYQTLYFEQPNLERYGIGYPNSTSAAVSAGKFFADATLLPIRAIRRPPHSCECTLGHRRPGDCNPIQR